MLVRMVKSNQRAGKQGWGGSGGERSSHLQRVELQTDAATLEISREGAQKTKNKWTVGPGYTTT